MKLKKMAGIIMILILSFSFFDYLPSYAIEPVFKTAGLKIDGKTVVTDVNPILMEGRTLVPARAVLEYMGALVSWDEKNAKVEVAMLDKRITLFINNKEALVDDKKVELDVPATIINGRTMIPVRFVSENLNYKVEWNSVNDTVEITTCAGEINLLEIDTFNDKSILSIYGRGDFNFTYFYLEENPRLVLNFNNYRLETKGFETAGNSKSVKKIRYSQFDAHTVRVVIDLTEQVKFTNRMETNRLVITLDDAKMNHSLPKPSTSPLPSPSGSPSPTAMPSISPMPKPTSTPLEVAYISKYTLSPKAADKLVIIDPGHGGKEPGAIAKLNGVTYMEKDINLKICLYLKEMLLNNGVSLYMLREGDQEIAVTQRPKIANELGGDLYLSIHNNASGDPKITGTQVYYATNKQTANSIIASKRFAEIFYEQITSKLKTKKAGLVDNGNYIVIKYANMPSIIIEGAFMTNQSDLAKLADEAFLKGMAEAICDGVILALNECVGEK